MSDEKIQTLQDLTDVIALPPLKMVLAHKKGEGGSKPFPSAVPASVAPRVHVEVQTVQKLIEHLEQKA